MSSAVDTNVLSAVFNRHDPNHDAATHLLQQRLELETLIICGAVFAEFTAAPRRTTQQVEAFLEYAGIAVDWTMTERIWRTAGDAYRDHSERRQRNGGGVGATRRILTDFLIGAHALEHQLALLTLDTRLQRAAFPELQSIGVEKGEQ